MLLHRLLAGALLLALPVTPTLADVDRTAAPCWDRDEATAARVQRFKTMLLVGALHCRDVDPYVMADYNAFVRSQRGFVNASAELLRGNFVRRFGAAYGATAYSDYETALGNELSAGDFGPERCEMVARYARMAAEVSAVGLVDLAAETDDGEPRNCPPVMARALPPEPVAPAVIETAAAPPPPAPIEVAQAEWPDLAPVVPESQPVAVDPNAAVAPPARVETAEAPGDPTEALKAAIKSLNAAVAALEAARPTATTTH